MKFSKVVFIGYFDLTETVYNDYYFESLINHNIDVEYLNISKIFDHYIESDNFVFRNTTKINSYKELNEYFDSQDKKNTLFISFMSFEWRVVKLFRLITKFKLTIGVFGTGAFPSVYNSTSDKYFFNIKKLDFSRLKSFITNRLALFYKKTGYIKAYDYIFRAGKFGHTAFGYGNEIDMKSAKIIEINTVDYDKYLIERTSNIQSQENYILFLDQYIPYHPDTFFLNIQTADPDIYYEELNGFFDRLEKQTGMEVVIAAHPKAYSYKEFNPYNNRMIFFNKSCYLVKDAAFVMTHHSTAICLPICYNKRIVLLTSKYLENIFLDFTQYIRAISNSTRAEVVSIDVNYDLDLSFTLDLSFYENFKYNYLTSELSENKTSENIFLDFLLNRF